jgi:hypothetical protein
MLGIGPMNCQESDASDAYDVNFTREKYWDS